MEHGGKRPKVDSSAYVAPNATLCGDVTIGADSRILFGVVIVAAGGPVQIGSHCIVMENAVIRGTPRHPTRLGDHVLVGPHAHLTGCKIEDNVFLATGSCVFTGARLETRSEVKINGVVHLKTTLPPDTTVPIGWVAVGDPARLHPPKDHEKIWGVQERLDFPRTVFGLDCPPAGQTIMPELTRRYAKALAQHRNDQVLD